MEIWLNSNLDSHNFIKDEYWINNYNLVKNLLPKSSLYLYWFEDRIVGFIGIQNQYIAGIFIDNKYRNLGIGTSLLNFVKSKYDNLSLDVYVENKNAVRFYTNNEFKINSKNLEVENEKYEYNMTWRKKGKTY